MGFCLPLNFFFILPPSKVSPRYALVFVPVRQYPREKPRGIAQHISRYKPANYCNLFFSFVFFIRRFSCRSKSRENGGDSRSERDIVDVFLLSQQIYRRSRHLALLPNRHLRSHFYCRRFANNLIKSLSS